VAAGAKTRRELLSPAPTGTDVARLQRLMRLEMLLLYVYDHVLISPVLPASAHPAVAQMRSHEQAHVAALGAQLTARHARTPSAPPSLTVANRHLAGRDVGGRLGHLRGAKDALFLLLSVERVAVGAYFVALREMVDPGLIGLAAQIMASDSQHEAIISEQLNPGNIPAAVPYGLVQGVQ
jgi:ferritin-like protein